ncbi:MAG TPA: phosphoribosyltransferase family protein [Acidobacteriota bacterium]|nr:phosphoribosyltransferase family protein [Acidobacteriota bacterium]
MNGGRWERAAGAARARLRAGAADLLDAFVDRRCAGCGGPAERGEDVCGACDAAVDRAGSVLCLHCLRGGVRAAPEPAPSSPPRAGCPLHGAERLLLAGPPHAAPLDSIVREFKYAGGSRLAPWIASLVPVPPGIDGALGREGIVVPVPLHPARRAWRGYDQAESIARRLGTWWGVPVVPALRRVRETAPQARLGGEERRRNLDGAFRPADRAERLVAGRVVLLVDDVVTTGATMLEAGEALAPAGPALILALAAAHGGAPDGAQSPSQPEVATVRGRVLESQAWQIGREPS